MINCPYQTINEIVYQKQDADERKFHNPFLSTQILYNVGDVVEFEFNGMRRVGRITTTMCRNGEAFYHIETVTHTWYQKVKESDIKARLKTA